MSAVGIGLAWAIMAAAAFAALSASALARTRHELEIDPRSSHTRNSHTGLHWPEIEASWPEMEASWAEMEAAWPQIEVSPTSPALRCSPSVAHMRLSTSHLEPVLLP
jgi:hypothetical protein